MFPARKVSVLQTDGNQKKLNQANYLDVEEWQTSNERMDVVVHFCNEKSCFKMRLAESLLKVIMLFFLLQKHVIGHYKKTLFLPQFKLEVFYIFSKIFHQDLRFADTRNESRN